MRTDCLRPIASLTAALMFTVLAALPTASFAEQAKSNQFWWPDLLDLSPLRDHDPSSNPYGADFDYAEAFVKDFVDAWAKVMDLDGFAR